MEDQEEAKKKSDQEDVIPLGGGHDGNAQYDTANLVHSFRRCLADLNAKSVFIWK
jgi:hypothetical protein